VSDRSTPQHVSLYVLTPEDILYEGQVLWVEIPLEDGLIGIWPGHAPLVASTLGGDIVFDAGNGLEHLSVSPGILKVDVERCAILSSVRQAARAPAVDKEALFGELEEALEESLSPQQIKTMQETENESV